MGGGESRSVLLQWKMALATNSAVRKKKILIFYIPLTSLVIYHTLTNGCHTGEYSFTWLIRCRSHEGLPAQQSQTLGALWNRSYEPAADTCAQVSHRTCTSCASGHVPPSGLARPRLKFEHWRGAWAALRSWLNTRSLAAPARWFSHFLAAKVSPRRKLH